MDGPDIPPSEGRALFGLDSEAYDDARPDYPGWVFDEIDARVPLLGAEVLEIGPGTGQASLPLARRQPGNLTLLEPDNRLHAILRRKLTALKAPVTLRTETFEGAELGAGAPDVIVAATCFHWLDQQTALARAREVLRPGGCLALVWNTFQVLGAPDPFHDATEELLAPLSRSPSAGQSLPFALDVAARRAQAQQAGFEAITDRHETWTLVLAPARVRALYGGFSNILRMAPDARVGLLDKLEAIARQEFDGRVERNMTTSLYLMTNPAL